MSESPEAVHLRLAEEVSLRFSTLELLDANGQIVDAAAIRVSQPDPDALVLSVPMLLPGVYSVFYKILSETDGHFTRGLVVFGVGVPANRAANGAATGEPSLPAVEIVFRWLFLGSVLVLIGAVAVAALVLDRPGPSLGNVAQMRRRAVRRVLTCSITCAGLGLVAGLGNLWSQAAVLRSAEVSDGSALATAWTLIWETRWGAIWLLREIALSIAGIVLLRLRLAHSTAWLGGLRADVPDAPSSAVDSSGHVLDPRYRPMLCNPLWFAAAALSVAIAIAQALMGHAAGTAEPAFAVAVVVDVIHLLAAGGWAGGILALAVALLPQLKRDDVDFATLARAGWGPFSLPAAISVALLIVTGVFSLGQQVVSVDALIGTPYGQGLLAKIGLVTLMGGIGLVNVTMLHPLDPSAFLGRAFSGARRCLAQPLTTLPNLIRCDIGLALLVLLAASFTTASPVPRGSQFLVAAEDVHPVQSKIAGDMMVTLSAKPNRAGQNVLTVFAASTRRPAPAEIIRVIVRFTYQDRDLGRVSAVARQIERDRFVAGGSQLSLAGVWAIDVVVRRRGVEDIVARFDWTVPPAGELQPTILSKRALRSVTDWLALVALLVLAGATVTYFARNRSMRRLQGGSTRQVRTAAAIPDVARSGASTASAG